MGAEPIAKSAPPQSPAARFRNPSAFAIVAPMLLNPLGLVLAAAVIFIAWGIKIVKEYERGVILRLGRLVGVRGPGIIYVLPGIEKMFSIDLRTITLDVPSQDVITRDNVSVKVSAVLYFRVIDPALAVVAVQRYLYATSQLAQTTLRSVCGQAQLDELLAEREKLNERLQEIIDTSTAPWGIKVMLVEIKHIDLPSEMQRAMARQAEAERLRRAKVISAEGEYQAATRLGEAAAVMEKEDIAIQLRLLQSLAQVGTEKNNTIIVPLPIDLIRSLIDRGTPPSQT
jgi:regulator of protease activity HflC (stomatin/prohibitin superfamily)